MRRLDNIVSDRGSKYAVSGAPCGSAEEARGLVEQDDGESGAGMA